MHQFRNKNLMRIMKPVVLICLLFVSFGLKAQHKDLSKLFLKGKYEKVLEIGLLKLDQSPEDAVLNMIVGRSYVATNQYQTAILYLEKAAEADIEDVSVTAWSIAELGKAYYYTDQPDKAVVNFKRAIDMKATRNCSRFARNCMMKYQMNDYFQKWNFRESEHLRFHFQDESVIKDIEQYIAKHEEAYQTINRFFKAELNKKIDLFVWKDREEAYNLLGRPIGFANSKRKMVNTWYKQTKGHEICHILCDVAIQPKKKTKLINEGICVYFDQTSRNKMDEARKVLPKDKFHLFELWESPTQYERDLSYPIGGAFIDFLINKEGKAKMMMFLEDQTIENAEQVYPDFKNLVKVFEAMLHR